MATTTEITTAPRDLPGTPGVPPVRTTLVGLDAVAVVAGLGAASVVADPGSDAGIAVVCWLVSAVLWMTRLRLYRSRFITRRADEIRRLVHATTRAAATVGLVAYGFQLDVGRWWLALAWAFSLALLGGERELVRRRLARWRASGRMARRVLLVGDNSEAERFDAMFTDEPEIGYVIVARVDPTAAATPAELTATVLDMAHRTGAGGAVVAATAVDTAASNRLVRDLVEDGLHVELSSTLADITADRLTVRPLGRFPVVYVEPRHRHGWRAVAKRAFDLTLAGLALVVAAPVMLMVAVAIRITSPGPVVFRQQRVGQDRELFEVLKFRTMVVDAEARLDALSDENEGAGPLFKMKHDPRITPVGRFLRKTSLDELPQLWNVVRNEMSLVGPRPALPAEMADWDTELHARLRVKPGITGMWQVSGRSSTSFAEYTRLDLYYVDNWSLVVDLAILAKTVPAVLRSAGAY
ncbi:MAG: sugar transferase [Acidimicrobiales bacterium]